MRVRAWRDILEEVTADGSDGEDWRAVAGRRREGVGEDLVLGHPNRGVYFLKTYAKNPYELRGVGARVARRVDDGLEPLLPNRESAGRFAVQNPPEDDEHAKTMAKRVRETVRVHGDAPTTPDDFFTDLMEALDSPAFGPMEFDPEERPDSLDAFGDEFEEAERLLDAELDDLVDEDEVGRGFQ
ncbi:hypothetical protein [Haloprofundus halophilus]|uniref:hypothetical protein n=1 Tax=Haloprofundus halophilus TaxID=2283527 RepID=UPI000E4518E7|nr:hypothetical protein [Haloprofundus halophilus]